MFFKGKRIARRRQSDGTVFYFFSDHLGSARIVTNATGGVVEDSDFYPFGAERVITDSLDNNYKFTGEERDPESGTDYFNARQYAFSLGRFLQPDEFTDGPVELFAALAAANPTFYANPANPQSLNKYAYVYNNPLHYIDPTGHVIDQRPLGMMEAPSLGGGGFSSFLSPSIDWSYWEFSLVNSESDQNTTLEQQIPQEVKAAIAESVKASNSPTADDKKGGFHEEGGMWGTDYKTGELIVSPAKPGPAPKKPGDNIEIDIGNAVDPSLNQRMMPKGAWHIHPKGSGEIKFRQPPSPGDIANAYAKTNVVVGAGNKRVYFYNSSGVVREVSLKQFMKEPQ